MEPLLNPLYDIEKAMGSAAEVAYRGADKGLHINFDPSEVDPNAVTGDDSPLKTNIREWYHGIQPILNTVGGEVNDLGGEIPDPSPVLDSELTAISAATGFSKQFIEGAAAGEIASSETNLREDLGEVAERQEQYVTPYIVRRMLQTLIDAGILPTPRDGDYRVTWPDLFQMSAEETATVEQKRSQTAKNLGIMGEPAKEYVESGSFPEESAPAMPAVDESNPAVANQFDLLSDVTANATVTMSGEIPDRYLEEFDEDDFVPPERAQEKAQRILDIRESEDNVNGGTDTGWSRAEQLAAGIPVPPDEVQQISNWFARHPKSEASDAPDDEPWTDNGWTARMLWGWDQAKRWADALSERLGIAQYRPRHRHG